MTSPAIRLIGSAKIDGSPIFGPLDFVAPAGVWTCILGTSGVGKSTLLRLLAGLNSTIAFDGKIQCDDGLALAPRASLMLQSDLLLPWLDVLENVTLGAKLRGEKSDSVRATSVLEDVGLAGFETRTPGTLSGGQRQRVALARTLMEDQRVMLLDEPFSALDAKNRGVMQDLAARLFQNRTVVLVTHDPYEAARLGAKVIVMTPSGFTDLPTPNSTPVRSLADPAVSKFAVALLDILNQDSAAT